MARIDLDSPEEIIFDVTATHQLIWKGLEALDKVLRNFDSDHIRVHQHTLISVLDRQWSDDPAAAPEFRRRFFMFLQHCAREPHRVRLIDHLKTVEFLFAHCQCCDDHIWPSELVPIACATAHQVDGSRMYVATITPELYRSYTMPDEFDGRNIIDCSDLIW